MFRIGEENELARANRRPSDREREEPLAKFPKSRALVDPCARVCPIPIAVLAIVERR